MAFSIPASLPGPLTPVATNRPMPTAAPFAFVEPTPVHSLPTIAPYYNLPASLMLKAIKSSEKYIAIEPASITLLPPLQQPPSADMVQAYSRFYQGLTEYNPNALKENRIDEKGWEYGALKAHYKRLADIRHGRRPDGSLFSAK